MPIIHNSFVFSGTSTDSLSASLRYWGWTVSWDFTSFVLLVFSASVYGIVVLLLMVLLRTSLLASFVSCMCKKY